MINSKERILWILYGMVLVLLFLLSSTDLIIKEKEMQVYAVSVIVEDTTDDNYVNFRKGMDRAAIEYNLDVSFITLYDERNREQQKELIMREQQDGSRALIVSPVDPGHILQLQEEKRISIPLVFLNSEISSTGEGKTARITFDYYQMGQELAEQMLAEQPPGQRIFLLGDSHPDQISRQFQEGVLHALEEAGQESAFLKGRREGDLKAQTEKELLRQPRQTVLIVLDPKNLTEIAQMLSEENLSGEIGGLYGRGTTVRLLNYLDRGVIRGLSVTDDFTAGYLSVRTAAELVANRQVPDAGYLDSHYIRREDLRNEAYEKMLYPIE